jgi:hypothetical protein
LIILIAASAQALAFDVLIVAAVICWVCTLATGLISVPRYLEWRRALRQEEGRPIYPVAVLPKQLRSEFDVTRMFLRREVEAAPDDVNRIAARRLFLVSMGFGLAFVALGGCPVARRS